ncbi:MAG: class I SAM-dependent methyltransferase [Hormoscilla sp.]
MTENMVENNVDLPYFDGLLAEFGKGNEQAIGAFGRHVHWGYWDNPNAADGTVADFAAAAENLCRRVCDAGGVDNADRILDCGCGFGGTIASLNERFSDNQLVGLNIDDRQLARAREQVQPSNGNQIDFILADACELPFEDNSFDVVLAVECIFHFPSRERFFQEARRVLAPGGRLAICDFVPLPVLIYFNQLAENLIKPSVASTYGPVNSRFTLEKYRSLAATTQFKLKQSEDITVNTLPTYPVVRRLQRQAGDMAIERVTAGAEFINRLGLSRYLILSFEVV